MPVHHARVPYRSTATGSGGRIVRPTRRNTRRDAPIRLLAAGRHRRNEASHGRRAIRRRIVRYCSDDRQPSRESGGHPMSDTTERATNGEQLLRVDDVYKHFKVSGTGFFGKGAEYVHAVDGVSLDVREGETLGLVGETGCGKSTLARCITGLHPVSSGSITFDGVNLTKLSRRKMRPYRSGIQMIFQ